jgi:menaquinone-dependent protoporphyrinogen oxidase
MNNLNNQIIQLAKGDAIVYVPVGLLVSVCKTIDMDYLIIYMSRHGTTGKVAAELKEKLGTENTMLVDLEKDLVPSLDEFRTIIIGGSVHAGTIQQELTTFCIKNKKELLKKRLGLFMCYMNNDLREIEFEDSFPIDLRRHAIAKGMVGGEFLIERMNESEKEAVRKVKGIEESVYRIDKSAIRNFIEDIKDDAAL